MNIEIEIEHGADIASGVDIEGITQYVLEQEGCPATTEVSITLTTDEEVHRLNKEYRGIDRQVLRTLIHGSGLTLAIRN